MWITEIRETLKSMMNQSTTIYWNESRMRQLPSWTASKSVRHRNTKSVDVLTHLKESLAWSYVDLIIWMNYADWVDFRLTESQLQFYWLDICQWMETIWNLTIMSECSIKRQSNVLFTWTFQKNHHNEHLESLQRQTWLKEFCYLPCFHYLLITFHC